MAIKDAKTAEPVEKPVAKKPVQLRAVHNKMRNPYTGATYYQARPTDVFDLDAPECQFERDQLAAGVLAYA